MLKNVLYGFDFYFGKLENNSDVFFGGLFEFYMKNLENFVLFLVMFLKYLVVEICNVIYGNCLCEFVCGSLVCGVFLDGRFIEVCE